MLSVKEFIEEMKTELRNHLLEDVYQAYMDGADIGYLAAELADLYSRSMKAARPPELNLKYENIRDMLTIRLLEKKRNRIIKRPERTQGERKK